MAKAKKPKAPAKPSTSSSSGSSGSSKKVTNSLQIKNVSQAPQVQLAPSQNVAHTDVSPAVQAQTAQLGPATTGTAAQLDLGGYNQYRGDQRGLISQLQAQAAGKGPSVAEAQFKLAADRGQAQQMSMAASQRGRSGGLAGRTAMMNSAAMNQDLAAQSAIARMQEQQAAQQQLGSQINAGMASESNIASQNAQLSQQMGLANMGAQNQFALTQAGMQHDTNLANASAQNAANAQQANIWANENALNATNANDMAKYTASLNQQVNLANAGATNQANIAQAQIYGQNANASTAAGATMGAAGLNAGSARYASDTAAKIAAMNALINNGQTNYNDGYGSNQDDYNNSTRQ